MRSIQMTLTVSEIQHEARALCLPNGIITRASVRRTGTHPEHELLARPTMILFDVSKHLYGCLSSESNETSSLECKLEEIDRR